VQVIDEAAPVSAISDLPLVGKTDVALCERDSIFKACIPSESSTHNVPSPNVTLQGNGDGPPGPDALVLASAAIEASRADDAATSVQKPSEPKERREKTPKISKPKISKPKKSKKIAVPKTDPIADGPTTLARFGAPLTEGFTFLPARTSVEKATILADVRGSTGSTSGGQAREPVEAEVRT
jgi:hypothetical protein